MHRRSFCNTLLLGGSACVFNVAGAWAADFEITKKMLRRILPDIARHDVYLCGPPGLAEESYAALREAGVPHRRIHHESFEF